MIHALALAAAAALSAPTVEPLLERARIAVPDAREIADLQVCAPQQVSRDGRRYTTLVAFSIPRKARVYYRAVWEDGRVVALRDTGLSGDDEGLEGLSARALARSFEACSFVRTPDLAAAWASIDAR